MSKFIVLILFLFIAIAAIFLYKSGYFSQPATLVVAEDVPEAEEAEEAPEFRAALKKNTDRYMKQRDLNGDGVITEDEIKSVIQQTATVLDEDGNEVENKANAIPDAAAERLAKQIIAEMDRDGDGVISYQEAEADMAETMRRNSKKS
jgi:ElaB/YqjD/DUF883 family membrane-anchored ribosome-binding protein